MPAAERESFLARIGESDEDTIVLADVLAMRRELGLDDDDGAEEAGEPVDAPVPTSELPAKKGHNPPGVISLAQEREKRRRAVSPRVWGAAAAAVVVIAAGATLLSRARGGANDPVDAVAMRVAETGAALPAGWDVDAGLGPGKRSAVGGPSLAPTAAAARAGALLVDLQLAVASGDRALTTRTATELGDIAGAPANRDFQRIAAGTGGSRKDLERLLDRGRRSILTQLPHDYVIVGAWAEGGRIAARNGDARFFTSDESNDALERARALPLRPAARDAAEQAARLSRATPLDRAAMDQALTTLLRDLTS